MNLIIMNQICLSLLLILNTEASFIIEVDPAEQNQDVRDYFQDLPNDRPIIGEFEVRTMDKRIINFVASWILMFPY